MRTKTGLINARVDPALKERAQKVATAEKRSFTSLIELAVERYCDEHEAAARKAPAKTSKRKGVEP